MRSQRLNRKSEAIIGSVTLAVQTAMLAIVTCAAAYVAELAQVSRPHGWTLIILSNMVVEQYVTKPFIHKILRPGLVALEQLFLKIFQKFFQK